MATDNTTATSAGGKPVHFVAAAPADPATPRGFGSGTLAAMADHRVVALVLYPLRQAEFRMLLNPEGALALAASTHRRDQR